jgi:hypothetical protein
LIEIEHFTEGKYRSRRIRLRNLLLKLENAFLNYEVIKAFTLRKTLIEQRRYLK